ncbi:hypothetical protein LMG19083_03647 [Ralstonia psammae]|uniref:Uncharacterized protein n=1 Tax=Ralstonia psammae TaxID=3058598 RepID=A0ABN9J560_9RALS|nr:hypothetical protein [Ralstonia sp. LMG 19083]CAJ0801877.1 hypothetical protein LMG19083_03647 [Ralstonia sp. LMG 19083]
MSASRTPHLPHATVPRFGMDDPNAFAAPALRIGAYELWFTFDTADAPSDLVTVCIDLGEPSGVDLEAALQLTLGLCLDLPASRGSVGLHALTGRLIYRFDYMLDDDPAGARLVNAMAALAASAVTTPLWAVH